MRKLLIGMIITFLLLVPSVVSVSINKTSQSKNGKTLYVGGSGPGNYSKIQDAIDNASDGDTVYVFSGIYNEFITIEKSIRLIGEDKYTTIKNGWVLFNNTQNAEISVFTITHSYGIGLFDSSQIKISRNIIKDSLHAIYFSCSDNNIITNNLITESIDSGIYSCDSSNNTITHNTFTGNWQHAIYLQDSNNCLIAWNNISYNLYNYNGAILLFKSSYNNIKENIISSNGCIGIYSVMYSNNNKICKNHITNHTEYGVYIGDPKYYSSLNVILFNNIYDNEICQAECGGYFNLFLKNYWGRPRFLPYKITNYVNYRSLKTFDWFPRLFPYKIPSAGSDIE